jgi:hypothetical protein
MFLGSTNEKATLYITGWRSVYGKPTLRYQHVVYQNLAEDCHDLAWTEDYPLTAWTMDSVDFACAPFSEGPMAMIYAQRRTLAL